MAKNRKRKESNAPVIIVGVILLALIGTYAYLVLTSMALIDRDVTIETGTNLSTETFLTQESRWIKPKTDLSLIDTSVSGTYDVRFDILGVEMKSVLMVRDTVGPTGEVVPQDVYAYHVPKATELVTNLYDLSGAVNVYYESAPDLSKGGNYTIPVVLVDLYGNTTRLEVPFNVTEDNESPSIEMVGGIRYFIGDDIKLLETLTVTDNVDEDPDIEVDTSEVDFKKEGVYPVTYIVTDGYGNISRLTSEIKVFNKPEYYVEPKKVKEVAQKYYDDIIGQQDLSDQEKVDRIFKWARNNIKYSGDIKKYDWTYAAYKGFTTLRGDCYNYYACCKVLMDIAGIDNKYVYGVGEGNNFHCWNLVKVDGKWYHCDACPSSKHSGYWIMKKDSDLDPRFPLVTKGLPNRAE